MRLTISAYWYPSNGTWGTAIKAHTLTLGTDGGSPDSTKQAAVRQAQAAGCRVLGYVTTHYGSVAPAVAQQHIQNYKNWYGITGIFFDCMSALASDIPYYQALGDYARATIDGCDTFGNPGAIPAEGYLECFDTLQIHEGGYPASTPPSWVTTNADSYHFAYKFHGTSAADLDAAFNQAKDNNVGYVYITDGIGGNPYSSVPSYWTSELALV